MEMVFVLDRKKKPLMPCTEKRARLLLNRGRAVIHRIAPFTIRIKDRNLEESELQPLRIKIDPGAKTTGAALVRDEDGVVWMAELHHKSGIRDSLDARKAIRRSRRNRKTRYREARFLNRKRGEGWLPPSLDARVTQTINLVAKLMRFLPLTAVTTEHVKFDTQLMGNPEIGGVEYQQGLLAGYELREYLLEKWNRKCAYCATGHIPLQIEHIVPRSSGGSNRASNLTLACKECNTKKGTQSIEEFLKNKPAVLAKIKAQARAPLKDAAMMNATRWKLLERLKPFGLPVECGTGARTKMQRIEKGLPKAHYYDACCAGASTPGKLRFLTHYVDSWSALGRGGRKMCNTDGNGFPVSHRKSVKFYFGFQTGDVVRAIIAKGKYTGKWIGRAATRASGYFDIKNGKGARMCQGISQRYMKLIQRADGWCYEKTATFPPHG